MFDIKNITTVILDHIPSYHKTGYNESVPSYLHRERNKESTHYDSELQIHTDNEEIKEFVFKKEHTQPTNSRKQTRFLIAESEEELRYLFEAYLDLLRVDSDIVDNGNSALSSFLKSRKNGKIYDAVILNTHLKGKMGLDVAREIHKQHNSQRIILVTTNTKEQLPWDELQSAAIDDKDILVMPFELSSLSKILTR
jgi:CheY-like chemotaxis protein